MDISLAGKVALITGAGPNIGSGIALALSRYGAKVACNDLELEAAKAAVRRIERNGGTGMALSGDVSVEGDVLANLAEVLGAWGRVDIVVNNAAWLHASHILEEDLASFNRAITIAVNGNFLYTKHAALAMIERGIKGSIVSILSSNAWQGAPGFIAYATHKGGLANFVRAAAMDLAPYGIRVNSFTPTAPRPDNPELLAQWRAEGRTELRPRLPKPDRPSWWRETVPVFVHAMPVRSERLPAVAAATFGVGVEGALAAAALITGGVAEAYPSLRLAFSHGAGGFPLMLPRAQWFWGRTWNEGPPAAEVFGTSPTQLARRFYYDTLVFDHRAIRYLIDMIGPDKLFVGSDFPAMDREEPAGRTLLSMGLPEAVLADITWHNCFRFLGIDPPKLFSSREQHRFPRAGGPRAARAVDLSRRRRAAAAAAAADPARGLLVAADRAAALGGDRRAAGRVRRQ